jgi:hypothetical protein
MQIREGHYSQVDLGGVRVVNTSGACGMSYQRLSALYFDTTVTAEQQRAFMQVFASFFSGETVEFPYTRSADISAEVHDGRFHISIPGILDMIVDRNWGQLSPPMHMVAGSDHFSNELQYIENLRYWMHDDDAKLDFDYSRRQANYRVIDVGAEQYRTKSMLIQYIDGKGEFNAEQLRLIKKQHLVPPDLGMIGRRARELR